jgi:hypothetical protein
LFLNLLLLISALLTGLTGAFSGAQRAETPAVHQSIAQAIEVTAETAVQQASPKWQDTTAIRRPVHAIVGHKPGWVLNFKRPAIYARRIYERLLV